MDQLKDREIRMLGSTARANNFFVIVVSVMFVNVITAAMITAGYQSISLALIIIFANLFMFLALVKNFRLRVGVSSISSLKSWRTKIVLRL